MRFVLVLVLFVSPGAAWAQPAAQKSPGVDGAIERGLDFLVRDALAWKNKHNCVSCHHAGMVIWSMREAKERGYGVDDGVLDELTRWSLSGDGRTGVPRPKGLPKALNARAVWFGLALAADPHPDAEMQAALKRLWGTVKSDQTDNGAWVAWPETRPPIFGPSDDSMTGLAALALTSAAASGDDAATLALDRAVRWLAQTKTDDDPQSIAVRLVLWKKLGRPAEEWTPLAKRIRERQNADGGWSQAKDMASDAWATGQALYALAHVGDKADAPAIARGHDFLVKTQRDDGSWPMTSRPIPPDGKGSTSLIPITGAGSAWGVLGLVRGR